MQEKYKQFRLICYVWAAAWLLFSPVSWAATEGTVAWIFELRGTLSSPALSPDGKTLYTTSNTGNIYAFDSSGNLKWNFKSGGNVLTSPAVDFEGTVYAGSDDTHLYAIRPDGSLKWKFKTDAAISAPPAVGANDVIYAGAGNTLYALSLDGEKKWTYRTDGTLSYPAVVGADDIIYAAAGKFLYAINSDGTMKWEYALDAEAACSPVIGSDGTLYVGSDDNSLHAVNSNKSRKWLFDMGEGNVSAPPVIDAGGNLYVPSTDKNLYAIYSAGTEKSKFPIEGGVSSSPALGSGDVIFIGSDDGILYAVNSDNTEKWKVNIGGSLSSPVISPENGSVYITAADIGLRAVSAAAGKAEDSPWPMFQHDIQHTGRNTPRADAGTDQEVYDGDTVTLDGSNSDDPGGYGINSYQWRQTAGKSVTLSSSNTEKVTFTVSESSSSTTAGSTDTTDGESLTFELTVTNSQGLKDTDVCTVSIDESGSWCFIATVKRVSNPLYKKSFLMLTGITALIIIFIRQNRRTNHKQKIERNRRV